MPAQTDPSTHAARARWLRDQLPPDGLFLDHQWRMATEPFLIGPELVKEFETLGRVLLQFYRALNLLYRLSVDGRQPAWVAACLDRGKPKELIAWQRAPAFKNDLPRVIRPDVLLTETGFSISELDSVPGGIGLTAWLNQAYSALAPAQASSAAHAPAAPGKATRRNRPSLIFNPRAPIVGGPDGMLRGFAGIFDEAPRVHIAVSAEAAAYRPEMLWLAGQLGTQRFKVQDPGSVELAPGDAVYRFFELFDLPNLPSATRIFQQAAEKRIQLTPPPKPVLEEKMMFALLWNRHLRDFWRRHLGEAFFKRLLHLVPYSWIVDPTPLPPQGAIPELGLTDWRQLKELSQRERNLILKISGFSPDAWGAKGVYLGSDLSQADWSEAVDKAVAAFEHSPYVLQRYQKPRLVDASYFDFERAQLVPMPGRVRLCPYYFVLGTGDAPRAYLGGILATICPADKKLIHGMRAAILAPCAPSAPPG